MLKVAIAFSFSLLVFSDFSHAAFVDDVILENAPILVARSDQGANPNTDRPLLLAYSLQYLSLGDVSLRYTAFFSGEDSLSTKKKTENQMGRYGRRLDVEWVFDVKFNVISGKIMSREYQCDIAGGAGHKKCKFSGKTDPITKRPILYVIANHNVFSEKPQNPLGDPNGKWTVLDPKTKIISPHARERVLFDYPELIFASDQELAAEGRLEAPATDYLYFRLRGTLNHGGFWIGVRDKKGKEYWSGDQKKDALLEKVGEDLWMEESFVAIKIPADLKKDIVEKRETLSLLFKPKNKTGIQFDLKEIDASLLDPAAGTYSTVPLTGRVNCAITNRVDSCVLL